MRGNDLPFPSFFPANESLIFSLAVLPSQQFAGNKCVGAAFAFLISSTVNVHRRSNVRVPHQFLLHTNRRSNIIDQCPRGVTESVPSLGCSSSNSARMVATVYTERADVCFELRDEKQPPFSSANSDVARNAAANSAISNNLGRSSSMAHCQASMKKIVSISFRSRNKDLLPASQRDSCGRVYAPLQRPIRGHVNKLQEPVGNTGESQLCSRKSTSTGKPCSLFIMQLPLNLLVTSPNSYSYVEAYSAEANRPS